MALDRRRRQLALKIAVALVALAGAGQLDTRSAALAQGRQPAPWCAYLGASDGGYDCGYYTFDQCMATARGVGNYCVPNPQVLWAPEQPRRRVRK
jgi:Protein of unknown function (DUF3551)